MSPDYNIPIPSDSEVALASTRNNEIFYLDSIAITSLIATHPSHTVLTDVLLKVAVINQLYRTNVYGLHDVANTIVRNGEALQRLMQEGAGEAVNSIRRTHHNGKDIDHYSFATKYCHLHQPELFPIFDSRMESALWRLNKQIEFCNVKQLRNLRDYGCLKEILTLLRIRFNLSCSVSDLDRFLYIHGAPKPD